MYKDGNRMMAWIAKIEEVKPIENADQIVAYRVGGWWVVDKKNAYNVGDLAVYVSIDSWIPHELAPFLSKGKEPREFNGVKGERLRTIKLRGQISQGLLLPWTVGGEGDDLSELLSIQKWEKPMNAQLAGVCKGNFPTEIPKTDQERAQNLTKEIANAIEDSMMFEVTEKLEGSSMTCYLIRGEFGVCSRNMDLKETEGNSFWATARRDGIEEKMRAIDEHWSYAIQGELIGPGIQGNIYGLKQTEFYVFDVYNIQTGAYLDPGSRQVLIRKMGLKHVPILAQRAQLYDTLGIKNVDDVLKFAEGKSVMGDINTEREGVVFKEVNGGMTFKSISNRYLLGEK